MTHSKATNYAVVDLAFLASVRPTGLESRATRPTRRPTSRVSVKAPNRACCTSATSGQAPTAAVELKHFPLDSLEGVRATTGASFDPKISADGKGSLRVDAKEPITVPVFEVTEVGLDNATLIYRASLQSEGLDGKAFLEMWVRIPGKGEFFSRGLDRPVTGTMSWTTVATPFFLQAGQKPDLIRLGVVPNVVEI